MFLPIKSMLTAIDIILNIKFNEYFKYLNNSKVNLLKVNYSIDERAVRAV